MKTRAEKCAKEARISALFYGKEKCFEKKEENYEKKKNDIEAVLDTLEISKV